jgi:hypothetical protein
MIDMVETPYLVIQCPACNMCHGARKISPRCQHCGAAIGEQANIVATATTPQALQVKVALANTPEELREELEKKLMPSLGDTESLDEPSLPSLYGSFHKSYTDQPSISIEEITRFLKAKGSTMMPETFVGHLTNQGVLIQLDSSSWQFIE